ncbi:MAG: hypothetical protein KY475_21145 [Planctomycetes bacterium]|nr:hypothetical protein [Planctomycetota bacterium]
MTKLAQQLKLVTFFSILTACFCFVGLLRPTYPTFADELAEKRDGASKKLATELIGSWRLTEASTPGSPSGVGTRLKFFTGTHWCIIQPDAKTGVIVFQHGGRYEVDGNKVNTTRDFAGESTKSMIGGKKTLTIEIEGDTMKQVDADGVFNETWKRVK